MIPALMAVLLVMSGLLSGSETAVFSLKPAVRRRIAASHPTVAAVLGQPTRLLVTLLCGNLITNVAYFSLSASISLALQQDGHPAWATGVALLSLAGMVVCGEILPKTLALVAPARFVTAMSPALLVLRTVLTPAVAVGTAATRFVEQLLLGGGMRPVALDASDYKQALSSRAELGAYRAIELALLHDVVDVADRRARNHMVPRVDVAFLDLTDDRETWTATMAARPFTDYPVIDGSPDRLLGTVNAAAFLTTPDGPREQLVEPALLAPENLEAERLVLRMEAEGRRLAILLDEFGGVEGVVGLAELCHAMLGEIERRQDAGLVERSGGTWLVRGHAPVRRLTEALGLELEIRRAETLGGALAEMLGRVPRRGDEVAVPGWRLRVVGMRGRRVDRVSVQASPEDPTETET